MNKIRNVAAGAIIVGATFCGTGSSPTAKAQTIPGPNPWVYTLDDGNSDGVVINADSSPTSLSQLLIIKDRNGAPIFAVGHVGGATVFGDHYRLIGDAGFSTPVFDVDTHGTIVIRGSAPKIDVNGTILTKSDIQWIHTMRGLPK